MNVDRSHWEAAALELFEDVYVLVATGPRRHPDWRDDLIAVMRREVVDPRDWLRLEWETARRKKPPYPFTEVAISTMDEGLLRIDRPAATQLLVAMMADACDVTSIPDFPSRRDALLGQAKVLLSRYGPDSVLWSNISRLERNDNPDVFAGVAGAYPFTDYTMDFGLVAVSDEEIGVFWNFWPI